MPQKVAINLKKTLSEHYQNLQGGKEKISSPNFVISLKIEIFATKVMKIFSGY